MSVLPKDVVNTIYDFVDEFQYIDKLKIINADICSSLKYLQILDYYTDHYNTDYLLDLRMNYIRSVKDK